MSHLIIEFYMDHDVEPELLISPFTKDLVPWNGLLPSERTTEGLLNGYVPFINANETDGTCDGVGVAVVVDFVVFVVDLLVVVVVEMAEDVEAGDGEGVGVGGVGGGGGGGGAGGAGPAPTQSHVICIRPCAGSPI